MFSRCKRRLKSAPGGGLTEIIVDGTSSTFSSADGVLLNKNQTSLIQYPDGKFGTYSIPDSVTTIESAAFRDCSNLTNIYLRAILQVSIQCLLWCRQRELIVMCFLSCLKSFEGNDNQLLFSTLRTHFREEVFFLRDKLLKAPLIHGKDRNGMFYWISDRYVADSFGKFLELSSQHTPLK